MTYEYVSPLSWSKSINLFLYNTDKCKYEIVHAQMADNPTVI